MAHCKVVVKKILNEELEHLVVELEGEGGVDQHPLNHLVQAAGCIAAADIASDTPEKLLAHPRFLLPASVKSRTEQKHFTHIATSETELRA